MPPHKAGEVFFHSREQVQGAIREAAQIVGECKLAEDFRVPAFLKALELLTAKQVFMEQIDAQGVLLNSRPQG